MERLKEVLKWSEDWTGKHDPAAIERRRVFLRAMDPMAVAALSGQVRIARKERIALAEEFVNDVLDDELDEEPAVSVTSKPLDLLRLADQPGDDPMLVQRRFEALCLCDFAVAMHELEAFDSMDQVESDLRDMIKLLSNRMFLRKTSDIDVYTYHADDAGMHRVREVSFDAPKRFPGLIERRHNSRCLVATNGQPVHYGVRAKDLFRTVMKIVKQVNVGRSNPHVVKDRRGLRLVVRTMEEALWVEREVRWQLTASGATVKEDGNNLTKASSGPADITNANSSEHFKVLKLLAHWCGHWYEFQIVLFAGLYSSRYALDDENHKIYKLGQALDNAFPVLYPGHIYLEEGSWKNPELRKLLLASRVDRLGWSRHRKQNGNGHP